MTPDPIDTLERELVAAATRAAGRAHPARAAGRSGRRMSTPMRHVLQAAAVLVPVIAVAALALLVRSGSSPSSPTSHAGRGTPPRAVLAVLRHPGRVPTGAALTTVEQIARAVRDPSVALERRSLREVAVTVAAGIVAPLDLAVVREPDGRQLVGIDMPPSSGGGTSTVYLYAKRADQAYSSVRQLRTSGIGTWLGPGRAGAQRYAVLVPDGIARVRLDGPGGPTAAVHDNVAGFTLPHTSATALSRPLAMTWLSAAGRVVHRVRGARLPSLATLRARVDRDAAALRAHLAVLRRPATPADRAARALARGSTPPGMTLVASSVRIARASPVSGPTVIAIVRDTPDGTADALVADRSGGGPTPARELLRAGAISSSSTSGHPGQTTVLVPDGVRAVALTAHGRTVRATVRDNMALFIGVDSGVSTAMTWYGARDTVLRRVPAPAP